MFIRRRKTFDNLNIPYITNITNILHGFMKKDKTNQYFKITIITNVPGVFGKMKVFKISALYQASYAKDWS